MSLLEDVFLEDEAGEAQELERVIEGDGLDERPTTPDSNENSEKEDEAEEEKRVVDHTAKAKRVVKNPRFILNPARLTGPRGIQIIPEHFKDFKFKGKGHEREDLDCVLKKLEHWAYRLYPKFKFDDCLKKIEMLGKKRPVMVHLHKIRTDQYVSEETVQQQDSSGDEAPPAPAPPPPQEDEFDRLLQLQIELARSTPAPTTAVKELHTPLSNNRLSMLPPKASSSPSISDEQKERMMRNRRLAEERRLARLQQTNDTTLNGGTSAEPEKKERGNMIRVEVNEAKVINDDADTDVPVVSKHNRTNVMDSDSSDEENDVIAVNESVMFDIQIHNNVQKDVENTGGSSDKENTALESDVNMISTSVSIDNNKSSENKEVSIEYDPKETDITETNLQNHKTNEYTDSGITAINSSDCIVKENHNITDINNITDENKLDDKKNSNPVTEELMDFDFTEDF